MKRFIDKLFETRKGTAVWFLLSSAILSIIIGCFFGIIISLFGSKWGLIKSIIYCMECFFLLVAAPLAVNGFFILATSIKEDYCKYLSFILYYGTLLINSFLDKFIDGTVVSLLLISFTISSLICIVLYLLTMKDNK